MECDRYAPLVEIRDKYPQWLAAKRGELSAEDVARYVSSALLACSGHGRQAGRHAPTGPWDRPDPGRAGQDRTGQPCGCRMHATYACIRARGGCARSPHRSRGNRFQRLDRIGEVCCAQILEAVRACDGDMRGVRSRRRQSGTNAHSTPVAARPHAESALLIAQLIADTTRHRFCLALGSLRITRTHGANAHSHARAAQAHVGARAERPKQVHTRGLQ